MDAARKRLVDLSAKWKSFSLDQERARQEKDGRIAALKQTIRVLQDQIGREDDEFDQEWLARKAQLGHDRETAIKGLLKQNVSQAEVMRLMGIANSQLVSRLYKESLVEADETRSTTA